MPPERKTALAHQFSRWQEVLTHFNELDNKFDNDLDNYIPINDHENLNTIFYTPEVTNTALKLDEKLIF